VATKKKAKRSERKGRKAARKSVKKSVKKSVQATKKKSSSRKPARKRARKTLGSGKVPKTAPKKAARRIAAKRAAPKRKAPAKKFSGKVVPIEGRTIPVSEPAPMAAAERGGAYGEEGWPEEELSAAEIDVDAPELDELESELGGPELGPEPEDDAEW
jgi:hypothetical protein